MKIKQKDINELIPAEYNPRQLKRKQYDTIKKSLEEFGFAVPIVVNMHKTRENVIIGGHQRVKVAKDLGFKEVPCIEMKLEIEKEKALNLRLNRNTGEWDMDVLANNFEKDFL